MNKILMRPIVVPKVTEVYIGRHLLSGGLLKELGQNRRCVVVTDRMVKDMYGTKVAAHLGAELLTIPSGEKAKTHDTLEKLLRELFTLGIGRDMVLIAIGGGVVSDLVGLAASIYMRGLEHILIPTTLLGMVDAAIGGKTAIDTSFGKNVIGTIHHPQAIIADVEVLSTLPEMEWFNGFAEIVKMGLIYDASICELFRKDHKDPELICKAIQGKITIVEHDPTDQSLRRILNFGHTIGHALETVARYEIPHGQAVAMGCLTEAHLSMHLGYLPAEDFEHIQELYSHFSLHLPKAYTRKDLMAALSYDKKRALGQMRCVLIDQIGHAMPFEGAYCRPILPNELDSSLNWMENTYG